MAVRFNYTGRKKINRDDAQFRLRPDADGTAFDATLKLDGYRIGETDARVWVEAYHRTSLMRFDFGRVGLLSPQPDRRLTLFPDPNVVLFRVKVTSESPDRGKLLAEADGIKPRRPDQKDEDRTPLLPVRQGLIGSEVWQVQFTGEGESPELVVNSSVEDWKSVARDPRFHAAVSPAAMRLILIRLALVDRAQCIDEEGHWHNLWWRFTTSLIGNADFEIGAGTDATLILDWVEEAVAAYARQSNPIDIYLRAAAASAANAAPREG